MKPANSVVMGLLLCILVLFVSVTAEEAALDIMPKGATEYGVELASGRCIHGCCNRSHILRRCQVCCASAEEAEASAQLMKGGMGRRGGAAAVAKAKAEANP